MKADLLTLIILIPAWVEAQQATDLGIDRPKLSMQHAGEWQTTLRNIHTLGATWFRDGPSSGNEAGITHFVEEIKQAKNQGLHVLINIVQLDEDYDGELFTNRCGWKEKRLSQINLKKFADRLHKLFGTIKTAGLPVDAVEFGNEDDNHCYNADAPDGRALTPAETLTWLRGYGNFLQTGAQVLRTFYPLAKVITFGMAHGGPILNPAQLVAQLEDVDGVNYLNRVDGYGTHIYPSPSGVGTGVMAILRQDVWALGRTRPLWVTEFGFLNPQAFPNKKGQTLTQGLNELVDTLCAFHQRVSMGPIFFFSYGSGLVDSKGRPSGLVDAAGNFVPAAKTFLSQRWAHPAN